MKNMLFLYNTYPLIHKKPRKHYLCVRKTVCSIMNKKENLQHFTVERIRQIAETFTKGNEMQVSFSPDITVVLHGRPASLDKHSLQKGVPYRIEQHRIGFFVGGTGNACLNLQDVHLKSKTAIFASDGSTLQINDYSPDAEIIMLSVSEEFLNRSLGISRPEILRQGCFGCNFPLTESEFDIAHEAFSLLYTLLREDASFRPASENIVAAIFRLFDALYTRQLALSEKVSKPENRAQHVFDHFIQLLREFGVREHDLRFYSDRLCLTPRYLGTLILQASGHTAKYWIDRAIITEAKLLLQHTDLTVVQVSDRLHFPNSSFFCKYFKRLTGYTPKAYQSISHTV